MTVDPYDPPMRGDHVEHKVGGGRGIYVGNNRTFVGSRKWSAIVHWAGDDVTILRSRPGEELWAAWCAHQLTEGEK